MRVVVAGAVAWKDDDLIRRELLTLPPHAVVVHGDSPGADALAGQVAAELGLAVVPMAKSQADYTRYRRGAWKGLNERMLVGASQVLVFHPALSSSRGSKHLVDLAQAAGIMVRVVAGG
jgi:hypothetical protein